jgi:ferritin-like metal-binding protein YciE
LANPAHLLEETLAEERNADRLLTQVADTVITAHAHH